MGQEEGGVRRPERAPDMGRAVRLRGPQAVTAGVLSLIVVIALLGGIGEKRRALDARAGAVEVHIVYATLSRLQQTELLEVRLTNRSSSSLEQVEVEVDTAYLSGFTEIVTMPAATRPYLVELGGLPAGETRLVHIEVHGERSGRHRGAVTVRTQRDSVRINLSTWILP